MISFLNLFATAHLMLSVCLTASAATNVYATNDDISKCLDLQAIGAAFAQSSTVQDFENLLNDSSLMLSNLDLNQDGYVDYLRVVETVEGNTHVFVIEAVLGPDVYQEVATVVADVDNNSSNYNVRIIGSSFIYGPDYIIEPVYVVRPLILAHFLIPHYRVWHSPWYWNHYPVCYRYHTTRYYSGYHACINSYMRTHRYCHSVNRAHYGRSFAERNANVPGNNYRLGRRLPSNSGNMGTRSSAPGRTYGNTRPQGTTRSYGNGSQGYNRHYDNRGRQSTTRSSGTMTRPQSATRSSGTMTRPSAPASSYHRAGSSKSTGQRQASPTKGSSTKSSGTQTRPSSGQTTRSAGQTAKSAGSYSRPSGSYSRSSGSYNRSSGSYSHSRSSNSSSRSSYGSSHSYSGASRGGSSHRR